MIEFRKMIERAVDQEELETLRRILLESSDFTFSEKEQLSNYIEIRSQQVPDLRRRVKGQPPSL